MADLPILTRGDHSPAHTFALSRPGTPALDLTQMGTVVRFMGRLRGASTLLFTKTIGSGVTVVDATTITVQLDPSDTASVPDNSQRASTLYVEIEIVEASGLKTTPWFGVWPVRHDLG